MQKAVGGIKDQLREKQEKEEREREEDVYDDNEPLSLSWGLIRSKSNIAQS